MAAQQALFLPAACRRKRWRERKNAKKVAAALSEYARNAPPIGFKASFDSLEMMEGVMRHFCLRALIEQRQGREADWNKVDALMSWRRRKRLRGTVTSSSRRPPCRRHQCEDDRRVADVIR
jgi:hypothetical protein